MKRAVRLIIMACLSVFILAGCSVNTAYEEYKSVSGRFTAIFPGTPQMKYQSFDSSAGEIEIYVFSASNGSVAYTIGYNDYPEDFLKDEMIDDLFDDARDGILSSTSGELLDEREIMLDGNIGKEIRIGIDGGKEIIRQRTYLVHNRLYQISISTLSEEEFAEDIDRFFESFTLTE